MVTQCIFLATLFCLYTRMVGGWEDRRMDSWWQETKARRRRRVAFFFFVKRIVRDLHGARERTALQQMARSSGAGYLLGGSECLRRANGGKRYRHNRAGWTQRDARGVTRVMGYGLPRGGLVWREKSSSRISLISVYQAALFGVGRGWRGEEEEAFVPLSSYSWLALFKLSSLSLSCLPLILSFILCLAILHVAYA